VCIRHCYDTNEIIVVGHNKDLVKLRKSIDIVINDTVNALNTNPDIIYSRKFSQDYREIIIYRIGFQLLEGYVYNSKQLINDNVYCYKVMCVSDKKTYGTTFHQFLVEDTEKNCFSTTNMRSLPKDLLVSLQSKNKSELL
jgi:hypothetical protein